MGCVFFDGFAILADELSGLEVKGSGRFYFLNEGVHFLEMRIFLG